MSRFLILCHLHSLSLHPTPSNKVVLQKLIVVQLANKSPASYETPAIITVIKRARHWSLSSARCSHSTPFTFSSLKIYFNIFLPSTPRSPKWSIISRLPEYISDAFCHVFRACYMPCSSRPLITLIEFRILQSSPVSRHFLPLSSKYSPKRPLLRQPQAMIFP